MRQPRPPTQADAIAEATGTADSGRWPSRTSIVRWLATLCGAATAVLAFEVALRPFFGEFRGPRTVVQHQYAEGLSVAHYFREDPLPVGWRVTGNEPIDGAPVVLIVGDSFVAARQVSDEATMGALIERRSRAEGRPLEVKQYGIPGGSAPAYAGFASLFLTHWNPAWVVVVLPTNDLTDEPLTRAAHWRMRIGSDDDVALVPVPFEPSPSTGLGRITAYLYPRSALAQLLQIRWITLTAARPEPPPPGVPLVEDPLVAKVPRASLMLLKRAYGDRLLVVHLPEITMNTDREVSRQERALEQACRDEGVPYASAHDAMIRARDRFILARGFRNNLPGAGHLNEAGHRIVADVIWDLLERVRRDADTAAAPSRRTD